MLVPVQGRLELLDSRKIVLIPLSAERSVSFEIMALFSGLSFQSWARG